MKGSIKFNVSIEFHNGAECNFVMLWMTHQNIRVKGLVTNYGEVGGLQNGRGGHVKFNPYEKGGRKKF